MINNNTIEFISKEESQISLNVLLELSDSKILNIEKKEKIDYVDEFDEYDEQGYLIKAKNLNMKLIDAHYEITVENLQNEYGQCPSCGQMITKVHDYRDRYIQDVVFKGLPIIYKLRVKRYRCPDCVKNFSEENRDFPKGQKMTINLIKEILNKLKENRSRASIAREEFVSGNCVKKILDSYSFKRKSFGEAVCIDEFKGDMEYIAGDYKIKNKYQTLIKDPITGQIIDVLPVRDKQYLVSYFKKIPEYERRKVKYFICDMNSCFICLGKAFFPNAMIIIDKFHFTEAVTTAFENMRKRAQIFLKDEDRKKVKNQRKVLFKHEDELKVEEKEKVAMLLDLMPSLKVGYRLLQSFYHINKSKNRDEARLKLHLYYQEVEQTKCKQFLKAIKTLRAHERGILDAFDCVYSNAYAEGTNNLIKVIKRVSYGLKNLERFKKRLDMIVENYRELKRKKKEHSVIRQMIRRKRKEYRNQIKAAIEMAA